MQIQSAKYIQDETGEKTGVMVTDDEDVVRCVPIDGCTWINAVLTVWVDLGGKIEAAD